VTVWDTGIQPKDGGTVRLSAVLIKKIVISRKFVPEWY
jgi:hypothetical protein